MQGWIEINEKRGGEREKEGGKRGPRLTQVRLSSGVFMPHTMDFPQISLRSLLKCRILGPVDFHVLIPLLHPPLPRINIPLSKTNNLPTFAINDLKDFFGRIVSPVLQCSSSSLSPCGGGVGTGEEDVVVGFMGHGGELDGHHLIDVGRGGGEEVEGHGCARERECVGFLSFLMDGEV